MAELKATAEQAGIMESFLNTVGLGKNKKRGKHATIVREGEVEVVDVDPRYAVKPKIAGQASSSSGFARGPVVSGTVEKPQR